MKRRAAIILVAVMTIVCFCPVGTVFASGSYSFVSDDAGMLSSDECNILEVRCKWLGNAGVNTAVATGVVNDIDYYAENMIYGDGIMLLADENGGFYVESYGEIANYIDADVCAEIAGYSSEKLATTDVYDAFKCAIHNLDTAVYYGYLDGVVDYYNDPVTDMAGYLTDSEISDINDRLNSIRYNYGLDVAIAIDETQWGDTAEAAAADTYDYYMYGNSLNDSGILFYISKDPRNYWFVTYALGDKAVGDRGVEYLKEEVVPYLKSDDYYNACIAYADCVEYMFQRYNEGSPISSASSGDILKNVLIGLAVALLLALLFAKIANKNKVNEMNTAREQADAHGYMKPGSFQLQMNQDVFLYSHVDRVAKPKDDSSSSSSGRSHGGGGGSY